MTPHRQVWEALSRCSTAGPLIPPSCKPSREGGIKEMLPVAGKPINPLTKLSLIKYESGLNIYNFENWLFSFVVSQQKWLDHFFYRETYRNYLEPTTKYLPHYWSDLKVTNLPSWSWHCHIYMEGHLKLRQSH